MGSAKEISDNFSAMREAVKMHPSMKDAEVAYTKLAEVLKNGLFAQSSFIKEDETCFIKR